MNKKLWFGNNLASMHCSNPRSSFRAKFNWSKTISAIPIPLHIDATLTPKGWPSLCLSLPVDLISSSIFWLFKICITKSKTLAMFKSHPFAVFPHEPSAKTTHRDRLRPSNWHLADRWSSRRRDIRLRFDVGGEHHIFRFTTFTSNPQSMVFF